MTLTVTTTTDNAQLQKVINKDEIINAFINDIDAKPNSKIVYKRSLKQYFNYLEADRLSLDSITRANVLNYKQSLFNRGLASLTVGSYLTTVRQFYEWTESNKVYPNVAKGIRTPPRTQQFKKQPLTPKQSKALLQHLETTNKRDFALINLLIRTGIRTIEATRANVEDITFKGDKRVLLVHGKGRDEKDNFVILTNKTYKPIAAYLKTRNAKDSEPLFISTSNNNQGGQLTTRSISRIAKEALIAIGLDHKDYTAHSLRHTAGTNILRAGGSIEKAQLTLRHTNPATTQIYTATLNEERRLKDSGEELIDKLF